MKPIEDDGVRILREAAEQAAKVHAELTDDDLALVTSSWTDTP